MYRSIHFEIVAALAVCLVGSQSINAASKDRKVFNFLESQNIRQYNKCGFNIFAHYFNDPNSDPELKSVMQVRPATDTSIVSSSGKFRIHFDTTGEAEPHFFSQSGQPIPNTAWMFADSVAAICDHVYIIEVDSLGFPPPPPDSGEGGGDEYDVYIQPLPSGVYGYTDWNESQPLINRINPTFATWMVIRNEFQSTYTEGIPAIDVTVAHEFNHGVQVGNFGLWQSDLYFYELTSTWLEQVVYPNVHDYFQYLPNFFGKVDLPFNLYDIDTFAGYERCVFGIFLQNMYGSKVMESIWNFMAHEPAVPAIEDEMRSIGVDPSYAFQLFAQWNYFTSYRAGAAAMFGFSAYPLAADYPLVKIGGFGSLTQSGVAFRDEAERLSEHFYQINDGPDTIGVAVSNTNFPAAAVYDTSSFPFSVGISGNGAGCVKQLSDGYCVFFAVNDPSNWGVVPVVFGSALVAANNLVFPQPFNPRTQELRIPYLFSSVTNASLSIYGISGDLIKNLSGEQSVSFYLRGKYFEWDGRDERGRMVGSGVYIYVVSDGTRSATGKFAVVRN